MVGVAGVQTSVSGSIVAHEPPAGVVGDQSGDAGLVAFHVVVTGVCGVHRGGSVCGKNRNNIMSFSKV